MEYDDYESWRSARCEIFAGTTMFSRATSISGYKSGKCP